MAKRTKSARGQIVDFDLLAIKAQEATHLANKNNEPPLIIDIKPAESFMDKRNKRRIKKAATADQSIVVDTTVPATPAIDPPAA